MDDVLNAVFMQHQALACNARVSYAVAWTK